ncbi:MAG TPA: permease-like cell division protein FtsX [Bacteroidales bacterium]|nr:permease-like cell division protein FtsX [Bacteroidales bacterium]
MKPKKEAKITRLRLQSSYVTSIISISLVLFLLGLVGLLILNTRKLSDYVKENIGFSVILKDNVKEVEMIRLQKNLDATRYVKATEYITKEKAARELQEELGEDFVDFLGYNPLLASIDVHLYASYANPDSIAVIENDLQQYPQVKEVFYQKSLVHLVNENVKKISIIILLFSGLLFLIAVALINNTIRLSVYSKRFLIRTMQLVGATRGFIRRPFLYKSAAHGIIGALIAVGLLVTTLYFIQNEFNEIISLQDFRILAVLFVSVLLLGIIINWISTYFAVNKYLNIKTDDLYI